MNALKVTVLFSFICTLAAPATAKPTQVGNWYFFEKIDRRGMPTVHATLEAKGKYVSPFDRPAPAMAYLMCHKQKTTIQFEFADFRMSDIDHGTMIYKIDNKEEKEIDMKLGRNSSQLSLSDGNGVFAFLTEIQEGTILKVTANPPPQAQTTRIELGDRKGLKHVYPDPWVIVNKPVHEGPITLTFELDGIKEVLKSIRKGCLW